MEVNKDYVNQSLINQIANLSLQIAQRDALITEQHKEIDQLRKEHIKQMDEEAK